jgi:L-lactate dehydrogenase (cytochrome)
LPAIVDAVGSRLEIFLDGGIRSGLDIAKAMALGARAVLIGRPWVLALAARGETGVTEILDIFRRELEVSLALLGVPQAARLDRSALVDIA